MNAAESEVLVAKVERREAPRPTSLGARGRLAARGGSDNPASRVPRQCTLAPPAAPSRQRGSPAVWQTSDALDCAARIISHEMLFMAVGSPGKRVESEIVQA